MNAKEQLKALATDATAEELHYTALFLNGLIYADRHPDDKEAAGIIEAITAKIPQGSRQELIDLAQQLAAHTERTQRNGKERL